MTGDAARIEGPDRIFGLEGRTAMVTGGSRGLGRQMVLALAAAGADVVIVSRKLSACEEVAALVREATGRKAVSLAADVTRWDELEHLVEAAYEACGGRLDILINNAGKSPLYPAPEAIDEDHWDRVFAVNLKAPFRLTALVGPRMAAAGRGSIINISSVATAHPRPEAIPYSAAKAGLNAITEAFAFAWGPSVRVNAIVAGAFLTDISKSWDPKDLAATTARYALGRAGEPSEIVGAALYLASDASSYTTGSLLTVDGGWTAP